MTSTITSLCQHIELRFHVHPNIFFLYQSLKNPNLLEEQNPIWRYNEQIIFTYIHQQIQLVVSLQLLVD
jgi:hypothetical protein